MASLDLNQMLNQSIANINSGKEEVTQEGLNVDLEGTTNSSSLVLDLESVEDQIQFDIPNKVFEDIKGALGAGVGAGAVLQARRARRESRLDS
ncbi:MAG: hypothetical protein H8D97_01550 [Proteobacteria bacterium]|nr:hypothetical protein [Pseudomonadota bacterium]